MPAAVDRFQSSSMGGDYAAIARALGGHAEHAGEPAELRPALERAIASTADGNATVLEVMTHEEPDQPEGG
jgi:thiamine pyrophosphate-dependent acetolactate synthase large subunit-like protein